MGIIERIIPERELGQAAFYSLLADRLEKELHQLMEEPTFSSAVTSAFAPLAETKPKKASPWRGWNRHFPDQ